LQWTPPPGSTPLRARLFKEGPCFDSSPPPPPSGITLGHHAFSPWIPLYNDSKNSIQLQHRETGAVRDAPWVSLRTDGGRVYFANLLTWHTRWLPPDGWMNGWVRRVDVESLAACSSSRNEQWEISTEQYCIRVDGGTPYLYEPEQGLPQYKADKHDSPCTFPRAAP